MKQHKKKGGKGKGKAVAVAGFGYFISWIEIRRRKVKYISVILTSKNYSRLNVNSVAINSLAPIVKEQ